MSAEKRVNMTEREFAFMLFGMLLGALAAIFGVAFGIWGVLISAATTFLLVSLVSKLS